MGQGADLDRSARLAARRIVAAKALGKIGDLLADAKTVLTWLMGSIGAPGLLIGMLVPIRESGSMLPQLWLTGIVTRFRRRKWATLISELGQAIACTAIAIVAVTLPPAAAGIAVLVALAVASLMRALSSIASKDVLGRTVPKGARGRVGGLGTSISGAVGAVGAIVAMGWGRTDAPTSWYAAIVAGAALAFAVSGAAYAAVDEPERDPEGDGASDTSLRALWSDHVLRRFVIVRALLLGSALGGPYFVMLGQASSDRLSTLAAFVLAGGAASASSSWAWGRLSDRAGNLAMGWGGAVAAAVATLAVVTAWLLDAAQLPALAWAVAYFLFSVGYAGVRVGRKTYVVDVASGDKRTAYVATSNTAIAIVLLVFGAVGAVVQTASPLWALAMFAATTTIGAVGAFSLRGDEIPAD